MKAFTLSKEITRDETTTVYHIPRKTEKASHKWPDD